MDLTTRERLVRLRVMLEEAEQHSRERPQIARHIATILLDGACEYAMGVAITHLGLSVPPNPREGGFFARHDILAKHYGNDWRASGWTGVIDLHEARNAAQHRGRAADPEDLARWSTDADSYVRTLCTAVFGEELREVTYADALLTESVRAQLLESESALRDRDPIRAFQHSISAFDDARTQWRDQRSDLHGPIRFHTGRYSVIDSQVAQALEALWELVEVQPFAGEVGEYVWLQARRAEFGDPAATLTLDDARRAFRFVFFWALRWEAFSMQYTAPRWTEVSTPEPPRSGRDRREPVAWELLDVEGARPYLDQPPVYTIRLQLADIPETRRDQWAMFLHKALNDLAPTDTSSGMKTDYARVSETGLVEFTQVPLDREPADVMRRLTAAIRTAQAEHEEALAVQADWEGRHEELLEPYRRALGTVAFAQGESFLSQISARGLPDDFVVIAMPAIAEDGWTQHDLLRALSNVVGGYEGDVRYEDGALTFRSTLTPKGAADLACAIAADVASSRSLRAAKEAELSLGRERLAGGLRAAIAREQNTT